MKREARILKFHKSRVGECGFAQLWAPSFEHTKEERAELSSGLVTPCDHGSLSPRSSP